MRKHRHINHFISSSSVPHQYANSHQEYSQQQNHRQNKFRPQTPNQESLYVNELEQQSYPNLREVIIVHE